MLKLSIVFTPEDKSHPLISPARARCLRGKILLHCCDSTRHERVYGSGVARHVLPEGLPERDYLSYYASKFDTVEVDSIFYRGPAKTTGQGWERKVPEGFLFAANVPQGFFSSDI
jgi:hypothetical protein